jgi:transcriptional repressor NF-X1
MWSKKMDGQKGKALRLTKNLGSASHYTGDIDDDPGTKVKAEKVEIINEDEEKRKAALKDKAKIAYNHSDFGRQFANLTEQCLFFVESLSKGTQECIICHNSIYQRSALWNCNQCHQPFHLGCIKRWIKKLNAAEGDEEEKIGPQRGWGPYGSDDGESIQEATAKKLLAFYSWTCPNCNYSYAENKMPTYLCYCGRFSEPAFNQLQLPHSCGEYCERKKHEHCAHEKCEVMCHPGSCPPCNVAVPIRCYCGKENRRVPCSVLPRSNFACEGACDRLLNCLSHSCEQPCHPGPCAKCALDVSMKCFCGKEERSVKCGSKRLICSKTCGRLLDCGKHTCAKVCHEGPCQPCQKTPQRMRFCPCGRKEVVSLLGRGRVDCTDRIPVCQDSCERFFPCGRHQCAQKCHAEDCNRCETLVEQTCACGKDRRLVPCYKINYPEHLKLQLMTPEEYEEIENYKCKKICGALQSCKKHKCKEVCCPVKKGVNDPLGRHLCLKTCNKTLSCGKHQCGAFCHISLCKPCRWASTQPLFCPCGATRTDPPIMCNTPVPTCDNKCTKVLACGHQCVLRCHVGPCPPCLEVVTKVCNCGQEIMPNAYCNQSRHSCGKTCGQSLPCGHSCEKVCHPPGACFPPGGREELLASGCGSRCSEPLKYCKHRCPLPCHPGAPCQDETPCEAEIRLYCKCGFRFVQTLCKSIPDREPIECNSDCWKHQRELKLALAFSGTLLKSSPLTPEYYPQELLEFARENPKFVAKCENQLTSAVLEKAVRSFTGLSSAKKQFLQTLVFEHFKLDMCTYGGRNAKTVTDVFWREGSKIPDVLVSEVMRLIARGLLNNEDTRDQIFEATLHITHVTKGTTIDDLKKFLVNFKNEMYSQKGKLQGQFYLHFYKKPRAKDALTYIKNTPNQFTNVELISHKKEVGVNADTTPLQAAAAADKAKKKKERVVDEEGFEMVE